MNRSITVVVTTATAAALLGSAATVAGIKGSKHDLGTGGTGQVQFNTTEVCVFCHTPHGANNAASAPLWNKALPNPDGYQRYSSLGTATLDGEELTVGSVSLACLSCHDGTQAMDVVINAPGSGGYVAAGARLDPLNGDGIMVGSPIPMLNDAEGGLRNDHPISIEYAGGACTGTTGVCDPAAPAPGSSGDPDFRRVQHATLNGTDQWWVDVGTSEGLPEVRRLDGTAVIGTATTREKTDMILYARTFGGGLGPSVECGSCHDPHEAAQTATEVSFLRIENNNSNVCLSCHIK